MKIQTLWGFDYWLHTKAARLKAEGHPLKSSPGADCMEELMNGVNGSSVQVGCLAAMTARMGQTYLLEQHSVVALKGLEDVMITAQGSKPVHSCIAVAATALTADGQRLCCVLRRVCLQACMQAAHQQKSLPQTKANE